tara:strand:- start:1638 stop:2525 length:888 start_codon:yes stop_codon:yes gene_type:complete
MRTLFIKELEKNFNKKNDFFISGDLGFGVLDQFKKKFSSNYLNIGICEQTMIGFSAGLSEEYENVFVYSISNFNTFRALEQVRNDICYQNKKIIIVSVGVGLSYGKLGTTHYGIEDLSIINSLPNINIYTPTNSTQIKSVIKKIKSNKNASYVRLGRKHNLCDNFKLVNQKGYQFLINQKNKFLIISSGYISYYIFDLVAKNKIKTDLVDLYDLKEGIKNFIKLKINYKKIIVIEEHIIKGGVYSNLLLAIQNKNFDKSIISFIGPDNEKLNTFGDHDYMISKFINMRKLKKILC